MGARVLQQIGGHTGSVNTAIFDTTGDYVVSGGQDKRILLSNANTGRQVQSYDGHGWAVQGVAINQDGSQLASCGGDRMVFVWDISTAQIKRKLTGHQQRVDCVATSKDGSIVASGSFDKTVCIWDMRAAPRSPLQVLKESKDGVASLVMTDSEIIAGSIDNCVRTYDIRMARVIEDSLGSPVYWGSMLQDKCLAEVTKTTSLKHKHLVYETSLPKPYRIVHVDPDGNGDDAENPDDMDWINKGREERVKRMIRLKITVDESNQVHEVECG
ncbi:hypothetical protein IW141_003183 [Coemansia sp. RSA 355]|nr:hypothetical protein IW141_003183 [Coemansia sp. RSA 355]